MNLSPHQFTLVKLALLEIREAAIATKEISDMDGPFVALKSANQKLLPLLIKHSPLFEEILPPVLENVKHRAEAALAPFIFVPERRAMAVSQLDAIVGLNRAAADVIASLNVGMHAAPHAALVMSSVFQWAITLSQNS